MKNLWKVPVLCLAGSWVGFYLSVYMQRFFFLVKTVGENGIPEISVDPVRSSIFSWVLFFLILVAGGLFLLRGMTKKEIALSAAIKKRNCPVCCHHIRSLPDSHCSADKFSAVLRQYQWKCAPFHISDLAKYPNQNTVPNHR